jgi:hypothetical protein
MGGSKECQALEERLKAIADISSALAGQIAELVELRERVRQAQLSSECKKEPSKKRVVRPGRLEPRKLALQRRKRQFTIVRIARSG